MGGYRDDPRDVKVGRTSHPRTEVTTRLAPGGFTPARVASWNGANGIRPPLAGLDGILDETLFVNASTTRQSPLCQLRQLMIPLQSDRWPNDGQIAEEVGAGRWTIFHDLKTIERVMLDAARYRYLLDAVARRV